MPSEPKEDKPLIFLSHAGRDVEAAKELSRHLKDTGVDVWLDVERIEPGDRWMDELERALDLASAFVVYVGPSGIRNWVDNEVRLALEKSTRNRSFRLIPILGPGADPDGLPLFLKQHQWLDARDGFEPTHLGKLMGTLSKTPAERVSILPLGKAPFRGLLTFDVDDAVLFFGREEETAELLDRLRVDPFLAVVGSSGSGKSSLVRAGLIPTLHRGRFHDGKTWVSSWDIAIVRPGEDPFGALAEGLPDLRPDLSATERLKFVKEARDQLRDVDGVRNVLAALDNKSHTLILVDQFEEVFTLTTSPSERERFIEALLQATVPSGERMVSVVITLRADFFSQCWQHEGLLERIGKNQYLVHRIGSDQLRDVVERPLALAGAKAEQGLVDAVLHDVGDEPGRLPLLEHALLQLWERRKGQTLSHHAYEEIGRLAGALKNHANAVFERLGSDGDKELARRFFESLTQLGEGAEDTRRRVKKTDLVGSSQDDDRATRVLKQLSDERLVTMSGGEGSEQSDDVVVEVAHEALIREWPRLRGWIAESRASIRIERRVLEAFEDWENNERHSDLLLRGIRLKEAEEWMKGRDDVRAEVLDFIEQSLAVRDEATRKEEERRRVAAELKRATLRDQRRDLADLGWGIIFHSEGEPAVREALVELREHRKRLAAEKRAGLYREFEGEDGYQPGESPLEFLDRHSGAHGLPYYLLLVGSPDSIPFEFEYGLSLQYAVGRIHFDDAESYARYARSVVLAEGASMDPARPWSLPREVVFFAPKHSNDRATQFGLKRLLRPLLSATRQTHGRHWDIKPVLSDEATKARLENLLGGPETPVFLFVSGHGISFPSGDPRQHLEMGSLVCQDWDGAGGPILPNHYVSAVDIDDDARFVGLIVFLLASYSAGTPDYSNDLAIRGASERVAQEPFVARLPQRLLGHPNGGALAVVGKVERLWTYSFTGARGGEDLEAFRAMSRRLLDGHTIGSAMEPFRRRYSTFAMGLLSALQQEERADNLGQLATATADARNYVILGDPATFLPAEDGEVVTERPRIAPVEPLSVAAPTVTIIDVVPQKDVARELETIIGSGVDGTTGRYVVPPLTLADLARVAQGENLEDHPERELRSSHLKHI